MYLKRLELKGFKSFADKRVLNLEPGISAIVGPNGSGKSNICDAILWVLGERNAKSLRGGVMEDVIFAGSSSRKQVSFAEVSLVLDNSDSTLPLEYNEVSVTRRLYRSGESEYLINNTSSRRLDVLDLLHDSGIGTDTNSIISQGHLDSILQSKPQDRRTLIEEAAGVLKHKQRKIRSQHKLDKMHNNLERINDVMTEIERQLKPLRIKAKRAEAYDDLVEELSSLNIEISVDDLKKIKSKWDSVDKQKSDIEKLVEEKKQKYQEKEDYLKNLREKMSNQSADVIQYSEKQRRLNSCIDKLSSNIVILNEKSNNAKAKLKEYENNKSLHSKSSIEKQKIIKEIEEYENKLRLLNNEESELKGQTETARVNAEEAKKNFNNIESELEKYNEQLRLHQKELAKYRNSIQKINDLSAQIQSKIAKFDTLIDNLNEQISKNTKDIDKANKDSEEKKKSKNKIDNEFNEISKKLERYIDEKNIITNQIKSINNELNDAKANIIAIKKIIDSSILESTNAHKWLNENKEKFNNITNLSDIIDVPDNLVNIVDNLLNDFSSSFIVKNDEVAKIKNKLDDEEQASGNLMLVSESSNSYINKTKDIAKKFSSKWDAEPMYELIKTSNNIELGQIANVVIFKSFKKAFEASKHTNDLCCVSLDGSIIYPNGTYIINKSFIENSDDDNKKSIISYKKDYKKLNKSISKLSKKLEDLTEQQNKNDLKIHEYQQKTIEIKSKLASVQTEYNFAVNYADELNQSLETYKEELKNTTSERDKLIEEKNDSSPNAAECKNRINTLNEEIQKDEDMIKITQKDLFECRQENDKKLSDFNNYEVRYAALSERISSINQNISNTKKRLADYKENEKEDLSEKEISQKLLDLSTKYINLIKNIEEAAKKDLNKIDKSFGNMNIDIKKIQQDSDSAIEQTNIARKELDSENQKLSDIKVELGKLEIKVQNAVDVINKIDNISVDKALEMPDIENREEKEERVFKIRRRIANMGVINPDAKHEYLDLKERFDFLDKQVNDLKEARTSLLKIDKIIDERMKDDFVNTFNEVNANFKNIFSILFPGGKARLELETPDDIENSGVEVKAQPYGKSISKMSLLSGGEKSLVALCLLFAVYKKRSTPFYILDEVEAALDDTNLRRLIKYLEDLREYTQLIMITHQRRTMEMADVLYGVSMKNDGVTKVVSQKLEKDNRLHNIDK